MIRFAGLCILLLLLPFAALAQSEEDGGGFLTRTIEGALSGAGRDVRIVGFAGALSSEASFDRMTIADGEGIWLTLEEVSLIWSRAALLRGRLEVDSLTARSLQMERLPEAEDEAGVELPPAEAEPFQLQLPDLPVSVNIGTFEVSRIDLGASILGQAVQLRMQASARLDHEGLNVDLSADRIDDVTGRFELAATVLREGAQIDINVALAEEPAGIAAGLLNLPGQPSVDLSVAGTGPLDDFVAEIDLSTDGAPRVIGQVALQAEPTAGDGAVPNRRIQADVGGDITALIAPEYTAFFGPDVGLTLDTLLLADGAIDVESFALAAQAVDLSGRLRLNADRWPRFIDIEGEIAQGGDPVVLPGSDAGVTVQSVGLDVFFDADQGNALSGAFDIRQLTHQAVEIERAALTLEGILDGDVGSVGRFVADLALDATGVDVSDADAARALGAAIRGGANIRYIEDQPIEITGLTVSGPDYGLEGDVVIEGLDNGFPARLQVEVAAEDLSRFAGLTGQPLDGAAALSVEGEVVPLSGMFDLAISGRTQNLAVDIPETDALLSGETTLSLAAVRDETGTFVRDLILRNDAVDVTADAALRSVGSVVAAQATLADIALVVPQYSGPVTLDASGEQVAAGWQVDVTLDAPYDSRVTASGLATGPSMDMAFDVSVPEVQRFVDSLRGPLQAQGRIWQAARGYEVDLSAEGPFDGSLAVAGLATGPEARVSFDASLPDMRVLVPDIGGPLALEGELARAGEAWEVDTQLNGPAGTTATIEGSAAPDGSAVDLAIVGRLPLGLSAPFLAPRSLQGQAAFDLALQGAPALESLSGSITTENASFTAPNLRLGLSDLTTRINLAQNAARIDASANIAAGGRATVAGSVDLASLNGDLALTLREAVLTDPSLYSATLDADIGVQGPLAGGARIGGTINLAQVNVTVPGTGVTSIGSIPEIRHVGATAAVTRTRAHAGLIASAQQQTAGNGGGPAYPLAIDINAPSQIFVRGRGLDAELGGGLELRGDTNTLISAGSFDLIRGRLDIIGRRFELDEGSVQFQGSVTPYIRFVTTTEVPDGTASITVDGPADAPEITFSAVPEAPQDEVLSLIIFGRYVSQLSAFQALELANGLAQLTGRRGFNLLGGLREGFGLDELDVTTNEEGGTAVTAGKYISDNIYTDVTTNSDTGTDVSLNIDLTDALKGKATVAGDGDSSVGLFFERDY
ncbi:translocation/assembly module TamB domain-containing protein [Roseobacter weihaiensis]|uniref:translocation/assembly module TamB domain-containing protein n=1 Tax=Roseobacter weihaiensis TaxID=2763262 RepID=UPI001D0A97A1|nr:translocation/assembly module TamB domain-containing protein [Roseobacter sp. H9]